MRAPLPAAPRIISFEPDKVTVTVDGQQLRLAPGQQVVPHGPDRGLTPEEAIAAARTGNAPTRDWR
jgi:hypothetical protein